MNLYLRLLLILLRARRRPRVDFLAPTRVRLRVLPTDLDPHRHVNNGRYLTLADLGRVDWFYRSGCASLMKQYGWHPVVGSSIVHYFRSLKAFQRYVIETRMLGWGEKYVFLEHRFLVGEELMAMIVVKGMFIEKRKPLPPARFLELAGLADLKSPALPAWVDEWQAADERRERLAEST